MLHVSDWIQLEDKLVKWMARKLIVYWILKYFEYLKPSLQGTHLFFYYCGSDRNRRYFLAHSHCLKRQYF
jgi:hypothetical protein